MWMVNITILAKRKNVSKMLSLRSQCLVTGCGGWSFLKITQAQTTINFWRLRLIELSYFPMLNNWYLQLKQTGVFNCLKFFFISFPKSNYEWKQSISLCASNYGQYRHVLESAWPPIGLNGTVKMFMRICLNHQVSGKNGYHVSYLLLGRGVHGHPIAA